MMMERFTRPRSEHGQGLVEFVFIVFVLLVVILGVLDLARIFHASLILTNASREGARYLTRHPRDNESSYFGTKTAAVAETQGTTIDITNSNVSVLECVAYDIFPGCDKGFPIRVTVTYPFHLITGMFIDTAINLTRSTEMIIP